MSNTKKKKRRPVVNSSHPNWVTERGKCDMQRLYETLYAIITEDVARTQSEPSVSRDFTVCQSSQTCMLQERGEEVIILAYRQHKQHVEVKQEGQITHTIATRWDAKKSRCTIVLETLGTKPTTHKFPYKKLWKVAQCILEPLFWKKPRIQ